MTCNLSMNDFWLALNFNFFLWSLNFSFFHQFWFNFWNNIWHHSFYFFFQNAVINLGLRNSGGRNLRSAFNVLYLRKRLFLEIKLLNFIFNLMNLVIQLNLLSLIIEVFINLFNEYFHCFLVLLLENFEVSFVGQSDLIIFFI